MEGSRRKVSYLCCLLWSMSHSCTQHKRSFIHVYLETIDVMLIQVVYLVQYSTVQYSTVISMYSAELVIVQKNEN